MFLLESGEKDMSTVSKNKKTTDKKMNIFYEKPCVFPDGKHTVAYF